MMKRSKRFAALILTGVMAATTLFGCGSSSGEAASDSSAADSSSKKVLKVGMECAYAPFNWTQDTDTTPDGSKAVKIAGSDYYACFVQEGCFICQSRRPLTGQSRI